MMQHLITLSGFIFIFCDVDFFGCVISLYGYHNFGVSVIICKIMELNELMELITLHQGLIISELFTNEDNNNNINWTQRRERWRKRRVLTSITDRMLLVVNWSTVSFEPERWNYSSAFTDTEFRCVREEGWAIRFVLYHLLCSAAWLPQTDV